MKTSAAGLIALLLDESAPAGDRDDAALDLEQFDTAEVRTALARIASAAHPDDGLADTCGQSLAAIWNRQGMLDPEVLLGLSPPARRIAQGMMESAAAPALRAAARTLANQTTWRGIDSASARTVLLVLAHSPEMYPFNVEGLLRANGSRSKIRRSATGAMLVDTNGAAFILTRIDFQGPYGLTIGQRLFSRLNSDWSVHTTLEPVNIQLEDLKRRLRECAAASPFCLWGRFEEEKSGAAKFEACLAGASTMAALMESLQLPRPEDALDLL